MKRKHVLNKQSSSSLKDMIKSSNAKLMTVTFIKSDGTLRTMLCKTNIKRFLSKKPNKHKVVRNDNLISVYDCESKGYRSFKLDSVVSFKCGNIIWSVK